MIFLAEISDKMGSTSETVILCVCAAIGFGAMALLARAAGCALLLTSLIVGIVFAHIGFSAAFLEAAFSNAVWQELGWPWVIANTAGPLLPAVAVACVMILRKPKPKTRSFSRRKR
jgi:hypothetical protein